MKIWFLTNPYSERSRHMARREKILEIYQTLIKRRDALRGLLMRNFPFKELRTQTSGDIVDSALDSIHEEITSQLLENESQELDRIEKALQRLREENGYGVCEDCGANIHLSRLQALPYTTRCIWCQRESEKR